MGSPNLGVLEAATNALNETYQFTTTHPAYALCNAYNKGTVTYSSLIELALDSTISNYLSGVALVQGDPAYGDAHLKAAISQQCSIEPIQPALDVMFTSAHKTIAAAKKEANTQAMAEHNAKQEIERQEREHYYREQERLKAEQKNKLNNTSLYDSSDPYVVCSEVIKQASLPSENNDSRSGLIKTFEDAITRLNFESSREKAFISSLPNDSLDVISMVLSFCNNNSPAAPLENVLKMQLSFISLPKTKDSVSDEGTNAVFIPSSASETEMETNTKFNRTAVVNDPDGYTNVRSQKDAKSQIVTKVVEGEQFDTYQQEGRWWEVRTQQGKTGYMHVSRVQLLN